VVTKPVCVNKDHVRVEGNPHTHLALLGDPSGTSGPRCMAGTLRPVHQGSANRASAFVRTKINPVVGSAADDWTLVAHRAEVILPRHADDRLSDPRTLFEAVDAEHPADGKALLTYLTLTWRPERLHRQWELGRRLATELARDHNVAVLLVQHVPGKMGRSTDPHLHLAVAGPRRIEPWSGFAAYVPALMGDRVWAPVRERFRALLAELGEPLA
jgi:hypothetical protein